MALTYTLRRSLFGKLSGDWPNLTLGDTLMNAFDKKTAKKFNFLEGSRYASTVASQQFYSLPNNLGKMKTVTILIGTTKYLPEEVTSREQWDSINATVSNVSDIPQYFYIFAGQIGFYPAPASSISNAIYLQYHKKPTDLSVADYTTGTIDSVANGSTTVNGGGTSWTDKISGRWIMIADSSSDNTGDGEWYEIESVESATALTLKKPYEGLTISGGTASYTIGQCSLLPEEYQILSVFEALEVYFSSVKPDNTKMALYKTKTKDMKKDMMADYGSNSISPIMSRDNSTIKNPNNYIFAT